MKTLNKLKIMTFSMLIGITAQGALANTGVINCVASNNQSFSFQLDKAPADWDSDVVPGSATDLHSMNVAIESLPIQVATDPVHTRTIAGFNYAFKLPSGTAITLTNITYASASFKNELGIKGHAELNDGQTISLTCTQDVQPSTATFENLSAVDQKDLDSQTTCGHPPLVRWIPVCCNGHWVHQFECN